MKASLRKSGILILAASTLMISAVRADEAQQPYIDEVKKSLQERKTTEGYSEELKSKLPASEGSEGYSEKLRQENPLQLQGTPGGSYTGEKQKKLEPKQEGGAIEAVREGHSELRRIKSEDVHNSISVRVGLSVSRNVTANNGLGTGRAFGDVYSGYAPDLGLLVQHYLIQNPTFGTFGVFGLAECAFYSGQGRFSVPIHAAFNGSLIAQNTTGVSFRFYEVPGTLGAFYRFNLAKYIRPYAMGGPNIMGLSESRSDGGQSHYAVSWGFLGVVGVSVLMDWVNKSSDWDLYSDSGIKHTYFNIEYANMKTLPASPITFNVQGAYFGIVFEY